MNNPKTTIAGYLVVAGAVLTVVAHVLTGGLTQADFSAVMAALAGIGLVFAADGGH